MFSLVFIMNDVDVSEHERQSIWSSSKSPTLWVWIMLMARCTRYNIMR